MKHNHAILSLLCLASMLLTASCGDSKPSDTAETKVPNAADDTYAVTEAVHDPYQSIRAKLDEGVDYSGTPFNIISYVSDTWDIYLEPEGEDGEVLNDAAFRRNTEVEECSASTSRQFTTTIMSISSELLCLPATVLPMT